MRRRPFAAAAGATLAAVALLLAPPASVAAPGDAADGEGAVAVVAPATDEHLAELTGTLEALLVITAAERPGALSIPEAEEMAAVAEELIEEGEGDLAGSLLEEAIALLEDEAG